MQLLEKTSTPCPIQRSVQTLAENVWFSKLDANSAYWQVQIDENDRKKTAFVTKYGLYEFVHVLYLHNHCNVIEVLQCFLTMAFVTVSILCLAAFCLPWNCTHITNDLHNYSDPVGSNSPIKAKYRPVPSSLYTHHYQPTVEVSSSVEYSNYEMV